MFTREFVFRPDGSGVSERQKGGVTYVNIPISPVSKKQLHYVELELQEHSTAIRGENAQHSTCRGLADVKGGTMADCQL